MYLGFHVKCPYFYPIITKFEISQQIFIKAPTLKFHENPSTNSRANTCRKKDGGTDGHDEANRLISRLCEPA